MNLIKIIEINPIDEPKIYNDAVRYGLTYHSTGTLFGLYINRQIVSVASTEEMKRQIVIKFEYTLPEHRKKGYGLLLLKHCLAYCRMTTNKKIVASCMPMSLKLHLSQGAKIIRHCKDGGAMIYYENL